MVLATASIGNLQSTFYSFSLKLVTNFKFIRCGHSSVSLWQHIDKVFKHKELQQQLMDAKLQRITEMMKEVEEKQQRERDFVSTPFSLNSIHDHAATESESCTTDYTVDASAAEGCHRVQAQV